MGLSGNSRKLLTQVTRSLARVVSNEKTRAIIVRAAQEAWRSLRDPDGQQVEAPSGRPATTRTSHASKWARTIVYSPELDGHADPGEIVWTWVEFEEENGEGKDRPVLVVGRDGDTLLGLMLSSQQKREDDPDWITIGSGSWDRAQRESFVRLDRILEVPEQGIRREGAILDKRRFDIVADRLRRSYGWS